MDRHVASPFGGHVASLGDVGMGTVHAAATWPLLTVDTCLDMWPRLTAVTWPRLTAVTWPRLTAVT
jgi:hypothetical protein